MYFFFLTFIYICVSNYSYLYLALRDRKKFFEEYATTNGFDPLVPENWYTQSKEKIMREVGKKFLDLYFNI